MKAKLLSVDLIFRLTVLLYSIISYALCCSNVDNELCNLLNSTVSDMCNDRCMAGLCTKFCGQCYLECYSCHNIDEISSCKNVTTCPYDNDVCFTTQTFTDRFSETYRLGCTSSKTCQQYNGISRSYRITIEAGCCNTNKCNNKPPSLLHLVESKSEVTGKTNYTSCADIDQEICRKLRTKNFTICSNECISQICPSTCGFCFNCLACNSVASPNDCKTTTTCGGNQSCFISETLKLTSGGVPGLQLGCTGDMVCQRMEKHSQSVPYHSIFGKRFILEGGCCKGHLCNSNRLTHEVLTTTTTGDGSTDWVDPSTTKTYLTTDFSTSKQPTSTSLNIETTEAIPDCKFAMHSRCPDTFYHYHGQCFMTGPIPLTFQESKKYCARQCLRLVEFDRDSDLSAVTRHYLHQIHGQPLYVGAERTHLDTLPTHVWSNGHLPIANSYWIPSQPVDNGNCVVTREMQASRHWHFGLASVNCTQKYKPLCQMFLIV